MANKNKEYYFIEVNLVTKEILDWGKTPDATLTGDTDDPNVHKIFLTKGQYNKLVKKLYA